MVGCPKCLSLPLFTNNKLTLRNNTQTHVVCIQCMLTIYATLTILIVTIIYYLLLLLGKTIAGTTDSPTEVTHNPQPTEEDIRFILKEIKDYLSPDLSGQYGKMH